MHRHSSGNVVLNDNVLEGALKRDSGPSGQRGGVHRRSWFQLLAGYHLAMERTIEIAGVPFDDVGFAQTVSLVVRWAREGSGGFICTPNVDYVVRQHRDPTFRAALLAARLRVPDGMGVVYGSWIRGTPISETVTGRLLPEAVARELAGGGPSVALFGGRPGAVEQAARRLAGLGASVVDALRPSMSFTVGSAEDADAVQRLNRSGARIIFVGLGAPKQEVWMARHADDLPAAVLVGVGAGIDVLGGRVRTAPKWMTRIGLEWAFRLANEPRRLAARYLRDDPRFFWWMLQERMGYRVRPMSISR